MQTACLNVCAGIIIHQQRLLLCQRIEPQHKGAWEFPGGKIELGESHQKALQRELYEELRITCEIGQHFHTVYFKHPTSKHIKLHSYLIESYTGELQFLVHTQYRWVNFQETAFYKLLPADLPIMDSLLQKKRAGEINDSI